MEERISKLEALVQKQQQFIDSLLSDTSIPKPVQDALQRRMRIVQGSTSGKTAASATVVVTGFGGVTIAPDGFITITVNNVPRNVPYYN